MKGHRLLKIREIVSSKDIETQEDLVDALRAAGFHITQATISRDIKELMLVKVPTPDGRYKYALPAEPTYNPEAKLKRNLVESFVSIDMAENLVIMRTISGNAHAVAILIDHLDWEELIGTVAGDDTILIICRSKEAADTVTNRFLSYL